MRKLLIAITLLCLVFTTSAQLDTSKFDFKFGTGAGFMGDGDMLTLSFENELNYKINKYLGASVSLGYGKSDTGVNLHADYLMGSANVFFSPFTNRKNNNLKIGGGVSFFNSTSVYMNYYDSYGGFNYLYSQIERNGFNVIIEDEQQIGSRFLVGGKLFMTAGIKQGGILIGGMIKLGVIL
jgi:hypothetical protein